MEIPQRLNELLSKNQVWHAEVLTAIKNLQPWLSQNRLEFFPEYTEHGIAHVEGVLRSASSLISDEAWAVLRPSDAGALVLSVLLHDSGMHLTSDGFQTLIGPGHWPAPLPESYDIPWPELWEAFISEALRFDGRKLTELFGSTQPTRRPPLDSIDWTDRDRMLIGEFVRRHHARLAHEIAVFGVPGLGTNRIHLGLTDCDVADLLGLVARSHGMSIRSAVDWLQRQATDAYRDYKGVFAPFMMALIRIADYLQIGSERAPAQVLSIRGLNSPMSYREWKINQAVKNVTNAADDPEAIFITALPENVESFLRLEALFDDLQNELDHSWGVIGETYGRLTHQNLHKLGLVLRRVRTNLDDVKQFEQWIPYVPRHATFSAADAELLKLLIGPLYGDEPTIGVRELLQNSVDAVRERREYARRRENLEALDSHSPDVQLVVEEDPNGKYWLVCSDRGIGMTFDIVRNYFLRAGASFRRSDSWRRDFEDSSGHASVLRSGRFGIGALAAFLLGDSLIVSTRHINEPKHKGLRFEASIDTTAINVSYCEREIGTEIRIALSNAAVHALRPTRAWDPRQRCPDWSWFCLSDVVVTRRHCNVDGYLEQDALVPNKGTILPPEWRMLHVPSYDEVHWTFNLSNPKIVCNGILVSDTTALPLRHFEEHPYVKFETPRLSIFDADGMFPLNLARTGVNARELPFDELIAADIVKDFIAWTLLYLPEDGKEWTQDGYEAGYKGYKHSFRSDERSFGPLVFTRDGVTLFDAALVSDISARILFLVPDGAKSFDLSQLSDNSAVVCSRFEGAVSTWFREVLFNCVVKNTTEMDVSERHPVVGARIAIESRQADELIKPGRLAEYYRKKISRRLIGDGVEVVEMMPQYLGGKQFDAFAYQPIESRRSGLPMMLGEWTLEDSQAVTLTPSLVAKVWRDVIQSPYIPFALDERQRILSHAYQILNSYLDAHAKLRARGRNSPG